ncbi:hypothetical protein F5890DRAFT_49768 [Lentinula detonsa]|uniref:DUF4246 domain-containing protein n=1 Tax=Lentinula detonsa TaxID=2804962 RepID=A0AA38PYI4_9AGAR|nr:hypothetical protein F5890DRAFT_49768 [Lentinula detonsa]
MSTKAIPRETQPNNHDQYHARKTKPNDHDLTQFYAAVREKKDWEQKIWDDKLTLKWAIEAELAPLGSTLLQGETQAVIEELRRRSHIRKLDKEIIWDTGNNSSKHRRPVADIDSDLKNALKYARGSKHALFEPELTEKRLGIFVSDDLVPASVHQELVRELDALAENEPKDFHPYSFGKVQDLIHPSLYPYIAGLTTLPPDVKPPPIDIDGKFRTEISNLDTQEMASLFAWIPSVFKVSPDGTDVHIDSYINGLGTREQYPSLFRTIEKLFLLALPHFEKTMKISEVYEPQNSPSVRRWMQRQYFASINEDALTKKMWVEFLESHASEWDAQKRAEKAEKEKLKEDIRQESKVKESFYQLSDELVASDLYKGRELKVIVKAANYVLTPGREYEGSWHMEGMPHERIVASVIYYHETDDAIQDRGLSFRKFRDTTNDFPNVEDSEFRHEDFSLNFTKEGDSDNDEEEEEEGERHYPSDWETEIDGKGNQRPVYTTAIPAFINLGTVPTTNFDEQASKGTGRMLSFPNWLQHKVELISNKSSTGHAVATRKILCFFLVDDSIQNEDFITRPGFGISGLQHMNVLTTSEVPNQMQKTNGPTIRALIPTISAKLTGREFPPELVEIIWKYASAGTLTREEAEGYRLELMSDRKIKMKSRFGYERTYSLLFFSTSSRDSV